MIKANANALGIIFPNTYDVSVPELVRRRTMASVPFGGRYRMIDFCLSGMVNAGIENVAVLVKSNYLSLMDHLGNGREWDLARKRGGLTIVPPFSRFSSKAYQGRIEALADILGILENQKEKYAIISDCNIAANINFTDLINQHTQSGADVTFVYEKSEIPAPLQEDNQTFKINSDGRIEEIYFNDFCDGVCNLSMNVVVLDRAELIAMVRSALVRNQTSLERDIISKRLDELNVRAYEYTGYRARIYNMQSYFEENMRLINPQNIRSLFMPERPVYTKVRDEAPVRVAIDSKVKNCLIADGCLIEGTVENSLLFRGVKVSKGAVVKNCVLMQGTTVEENANLSYVVTDKNVTITQDKILTGDERFPVFVDKGVTV